LADGAADRVLRAMDTPIIDPAARVAALGKRALKISDNLKTTSPVIIYTATGPAPGKRRWSTRSTPETAC